MSHGARTPRARNNTMDTKSPPVAPLALAPCSAFWKSPALKHRSKHYPERFGDRVPLRIKMLMNVRPDPWCAAIQGKPGTILRREETYVAWTNSHGAAAGICENGEVLGVKPDEFEVAEWYSPNVADEPRAGSALSPKPQSLE